MKLIEIKALDNGAHNNNNINTYIPVPDGWAVIPDDMPIPDTFPFVNITVEDGVVVSMTPGIMPEVDEQPSQLDIIEAQVTYTAMMTDTLLEG